jgi:hypothetical protein
MKYTSLIAPATAAAMMVGAPSLSASSHSDAPLIKQDIQANLTDVYAFIGNRYDDDSQQVLNVLVSVHPFSEPGDGLIYDRFADDAQYSIHITNPVTGVVVDRYDFQFSSVTGDLNNPGSILSYGRGEGLAAGPITEIDGPTQNYTQTYTVRKNGQVIGQDLLTPPPNVGVNTTPGYNGPDGKAVSGAGDLAGLDPLTEQAISPVDGGVVAWAGPREDGFYADTPAIFDLLNARIVNNDGDPMDGIGQDGDGVDGFKGFNVLSYCLQIPLDDLTTSPYTDLLGNDLNGVGVYASVSRKRTTIRLSNGTSRSAGPWIQQNRLGNPLFNEVLVALQDKDKYNTTSPVNDDQFMNYAMAPELPILINFVLFGDDGQGNGADTNDTPGDEPLQINNRSDLATIFLPDVIRVNTESGPVPLPSQEGFNRLSVFGGDLSGWPNGRRIGDDVVDIALSAVASGPSGYGDPTIVGDNIGENDQDYNLVFPYLGTPHSGTGVDQRQSPPVPQPTN